MGHEDEGFSRDFCGRMLKSSQKQKYQVSEHTGLIKYTCKICQKGFNIRALFEKHVLDHQH